MQGVSRGFNTTTGYFINCKSLSLLPESPPSFTQAGKHEFNEFCWSPGFRYFDARNQNSNSVLQSSTVGRFAKQIYFNLFTWSLADQSWVQNNIVIIISGQIVICFQYILICMKYIQKYISATWWSQHSETNITIKILLVYFRNIHYNFQLVHTYIWYTFIDKEIYKYPSHLRISLVSFLCRLF